MYEDKGEEELVEREEWDARLCGHESRTKRKERFPKTRSEKKSTEKI
jgi:hypothetical protein